MKFNTNKDYKFCKDTNDGFKMLKFIVTENKTHSESILKSTCN